MEFSLFAPTLSDVQLIGSWSDAPVQMTKDGAGEWRAGVELPDGRHSYRFRLESRSSFMNGAILDVTDPRARLIDDRNGDASIVLVRGGRDVTTDPEFPWRHDDVRLPQDHELIIYELHIAEFGWDGDHPGTFERVIERLDYLVELGVNAIELMPIAAFPGDRSWGYNIRHQFAVENSYGSPSDFKRLVDECHGRGIRVIMDLVLNHTETESPLTRIDFHYWFRDDREGELSFGPKLDYERIDDQTGVMPARKFGHEIAGFWLPEYHLDGYRLDATAVLDNFDFVREVRAIANERSGGKPVFIVAEQLPEDPAIAGPDAPADGAWHQRFERAVVESLRDVNDGSTEELRYALQPANSGYVDPALVVNYVESHDEQTLMHVLAQDGTFGDAAFRKHKLAAALLFTAVGIPMLYQGQEFGGHRMRDLEVRPLQWDLLDQDYGLHLKEHYESLIRVRKEYPALAGAELEVLEGMNERGLVAYRRGSGDQRVIVIANVLDEDREIAVPLETGSWRELTFGYDLAIDNEPLLDSLPASRAKIYVPR